MRNTIKRRCAFVLSLIIVTIAPLVVVGCEADEAFEDRVLKGFELETQLKALSDVGRAEVCDRVKDHISARLSPAQTHALSCVFVGLIGSQLTQNPDTCYALNDQCVEQNEPIDMVSPRCEPEGLSTCEATVEELEACVIEFEEARTLQAGALSCEIEDPDTLRGLLQPELPSCEAIEAKCPAVSTLDS